MRSIFAIIYVYNDIIYYFRFRSPSSEFLQYLKRRKSTNNANKRQTRIYMRDLWMKVIYREGNIRENSTKIR